MFVSKLGTFVALGVRGSRMIENCSINLGEFYVKMYILIEISNSSEENKNLRNLQALL